MEVELGTLESNIAKFRDLSWWSFYKDFGNIIQAAGAPKARGLRFGWEGLQRVKARDTGLWSICIKVQVKILRVIGNGRVLGQEEKYLLHNPY